jgi:glutathione S-transferase
MRLLGRLSSINVRKAAWACDESGLAFRQEDWGTGFRSTREPGFLALNPNALVPVLVDGETVLWESNTIVRYLAGKAGRADLLPTDPARRARVEQWMDWQATELNGAWSYAFLALVRKSPAHQEPERIRASLAEWDRLMGLLDRHLAAGGPHVAGADFTVADIVLGLSTHRWRSTPHDLPDLPALAAYYDRLCQRPAFRKYGPDGGP